MRRRTGFEDVLVLLLEFFHGDGACATCTLVRRNVDLLDVRNLFDRVEHHNHHDGRAVRVRNDALAAIFSLVELDVFGVHFGHDQRDLRVHAEETRVVHHHGAVLDGDGGEFLGNRGTGGAEHQVNTLEGILVQNFALEGFALELEFLARAALGGEELEALQREVAFLEDGEDFLAHGAGLNAFLLLQVYQFQVKF